MGTYIFFPKPYGICQKMMQLRNTVYTEGSIFWKFISAFEVKKLQRHCSRANLPIGGMMGILTGGLPKLTRPT
jgi:hypothetical protein